MQLNLLLRHLRLALAVTLVALAAGVPEVASAALGGDCCAERCGGDLDGEHCPPNCTSAACGKVFPAAFAPWASKAAVAPPRHASLPPNVVAPVLPLVQSGVFHPPRA